MKANMAEQIRKGVAKWGNTILLVLAVATAGSTVVTGWAYFQLDQTYARKSAAATPASVEAVANALAAHVDDGERRLSDKVLRLEYVPRSEYSLTLSAIDRRDADKDRRLERMEEKIDRLLELYSRQ